MADVSAGPQCREARIRWFAGTYYRHACAGGVCVCVFARARARVCVCVCVCVRFVVESYTSPIQTSPKIRQEYQSCNLPSSKTGVFLNGLGFRFPS